MGRAAEKLYEETANLAKTEPQATRFLEVLEEALELPDDERQALVLHLRDVRDAAKKARSGRGAVISLGRAQACPRRRADWRGRR